MAPMDRNALTGMQADRIAFTAMLPELLRTHPGKYALLRDAKFIDAFDDMDAAYKAGLQRFGLEPIYIAHIVEKPRSEQIPALVLGVIRACV